jgi:hypothetical protein
MSTDELVHEIREAFGEVRRPKRTMADAEVEDDQNNAARFEELDRHWWEIPDSLLDACSAPFASCPLRALFTIFRPT